MVLNNGPQFNKYLKIYMEKGKKDPRERVHKRLCDYSFNGNRLYDNVVYKQLFVINRMRDRMIQLIIATGIF